MGNMTNNTDTSADTNTVNELPEVATPAQLAAFLGRTPSGLANDRYRGKGIPYTKTGNRVRYLRRDVLDYLDAHRIDTNA